MITVRAFKHGLRLAGAMYYALLVGLVSLVLPFSAWPSGPLHSLLGGLFHELGGWEVFWNTLGLLVLLWSVMFTEGMLIDDLKGWTLNGEDYIEPWAQKFWNQSITLKQLLAYTSFALPTVLVIGHFSRLSFFHFCLVVLAALLAGAVILLLVCTPLRLLKSDPRYGPPFVAVNIGLVEWLWRGAGRALPGVKQLCQALLKMVCQPLLWITQQKWASGFFSLGLVSVNGSLQPDRQPRVHLFAATVFCCLVGIGAGMAILFNPASRLGHLPALAYAIIAVILFTWVNNFLRFHARRYRLPVVVILLLSTWLVFQLLHVDHHFKTRVVPWGSVPDPRLTPVEAVVAGGNPSNLVIVTATGGGILSAAWTTLVLEELMTNRPALRSEIQLISGVSGGAVGAAFYVDALLRHPSNAPPARMAEQAWSNAAASSLGAVTYGLAMVDIPRILTGGVLPPSAAVEIDRGNWLEDAWRRNAARGHSGLDLLPSMHAYNQGVREGRVPSVIFSSTVMETGERVMFTNNRFPGDPIINHEFARARTFEEYCLDGEAGLDVSLWTAARMSATFPFVSPAARPDFQGALPRVYTTNQSARPYHHFLDGGYFDNFGVASAMDWLEPILQDRLKTNETRLKFSKVIIIQLRAYEPDGQARPASGWASAILGPVKGMWSVYQSGARARNEIALQRAMESWNARFGSALLQTRIIQRPKTGGPLSWHLTLAHQADLRKDLEDLKKGANPIGEVIELLGPPPGTNKPPNGPWVLRGP